jgi:excisionase family DNA binding protein
MSDDVQDDIPAYDTISEAAAALRVSRSTIHHLINKGYLRRVKLLHQTRIPHADVVRVGREGTA